MAGAQITPAVAGLLQRGCSNCHSDAPQYPWYGYVFPVSSWLQRNTGNGRQQLNLSTWDQYPKVRQLRALSTMSNMMRQRDMPPEAFMQLHPEARLTPAEVDSFATWAASERARLIEEMGR